MEYIGRVASRSTYFSADIILNEKFWNKVPLESFCLIRNVTGDRILAVVRDGVSIAQNFPADKITPYTSKLRVSNDADEKFSDQRRQVYVSVEALGKVDLETGLLRPNNLLIQSVSPVYLLASEDEPMRYLIDEEVDPQITVGCYAKYPQQRVPVKPSYASYHIGVFGTTGCGKTSLVMCEIIPFFLDIGFHVLIIDWKGGGQPDSYTIPYPKNVVKGAKIEMDEEMMTSYILDRVRYFGYTREYKERNPIYQALREVLDSDEFQILLREGDFSSSLEKFKELVEKNLSDAYTDKHGNLTVRGEKLLKRFRSYFRYFTVDNFRALVGQIPPDDVVEQALKSREPVVVDLAQLTREHKLSTFLGIAYALRERIGRGEKLKLALIIDEAPEYCPFQPVGIQRDTREVITQLCAEACSAELSIVLIAQGIAGARGINADVRRLLNTRFIGKLGASDLSMPEVKSLVQTMGVKEDFLKRMTGVGGERYFYIDGSLCPVDRPLLITFNLKERMDYVRRFYGAN